MVCLSGRRLNLGNGDGREPPRGRETSFPYDNEVSVGLIWGRGYPNLLMTLGEPPMRSFACCMQARGPAEAESAEILMVTKPHTRSGSPETKTSPIDSIGGGGGNRKLSIQGTRRKCYLFKTESTSSSNSESLPSDSSKHSCLAWPTFGITLSQVSQRRKSASNFALGIPSGPSSSDMIETTSVLEALDRIFEDEDGS